MRVFNGDEVFEELLNISAYIAAENEAAAHNFLNACDETFLFLANNSNIGTIRHFENSLLKNVRMWRVKGFEKYLIFYQPTIEGVTILHIVHGSRDLPNLFGEEK